MTIASSAERLRARRVISYSRLAHACWMVFAVGDLAHAAGTPAHESIGIAEVVFDTDTLQARGVDLGAAEQLSKIARFPAGRQDINLVVNGAGKGRVSLLIDQAGRLCVSDDLITAAGLLSSSLSASTAQPLPSTNGVIASECVILEAALQGAVVRAAPGDQEIAVLIPAEHLQRATAVKREYERRGAGATFNYDSLFTGYRKDGSGSQYLSIGTEAGLNVGRFALRSRQTFTAVNGRQGLEHVHAYAARTWDKYGTHVQVGQLNSASPLDAVGLFTGVQVFPESALTTHYTGLDVPVTGIAHAASRVEVRQNGALIFNTLVPAGAFSLSDVPLFNRSIDLEVRVVGEDGTERKFTVPATQLQSSTLERLPRYHVAAGRLRRVGKSQGPRSQFVTASNGWYFGRRTDLSLGVLVGDDYRSISSSAQHLLGRRVAGNLRHSLSTSRREGVAGHQTSLSVSTTLGTDFSTNLAAIRKSRGYRTFGEVQRLSSDGAELGQVRDQLSAGVSWSSQRAGAFSASYSRTRAYGQGGGSRLGLGWARSFGRASLSLDFVHSIGASGVEEEGDSAFLSLNIPLGKGATSRTYVDHVDGRGERMGTKLTQRVDDNLSYSTVIERRRNGDLGLNARVDAVPRYLQVGAGVSRSADGGMGYDASFRGGLALDRHGLMLSPYALSDTFVTLQAGADAGVKIRTPSGPVWTDRHGRAVASLQPYRESALVIDTTSLGRNVEVSNSFKSLAAARGAVPHVQFDIATVRRALLTAQLESGKSVAKGSSVYDAEGRYITSVGKDGQLFLSDATRQTAPLQIDSQDGRCELQFTLPARSQSTEFYEEASAQCVQL